MGLKYEIRDGVNRADACKVYFCCHHHEHREYKDKMKELLLDISGVECAFYYDEKPKGKKDEDWNELLSNMNLFVVIVTRKFLFEDNQAKKEFFYASKQGIPVIPIVTDARLMNAFNQISNGVHAFLADETTNKSMRQLKQSLTTYMNAVLTNNAVLRRIHKASEGHLFMSYRKKDRKQLIELINRIHEDDKCIDIPIWYDDFLVAGERFDDQIAEKLLDGSIFVLTVTPNLIKEDNYVRQCEYKMAIENNKPIVPVEMENTNKEILENQYEKIPKCIKKEEHEEIVAALCEILKEQNSNDVSDEISESERSYLVGMGYLTGTDREKNIPRALKKIIGSANTGYIEAQRELVRMYKIGDGVERDFAQAISWQRKLIKQMKEKTMQNLIDSKEVIEQRMILADLLVKNLQRGEAKEVYKEIIAETEANLSQENSSAKERLSILEKEDEEMKKLEETRKALQSKLEEINDINMGLDLAEQAEAMDMFEVAKEAYEKVLEIGKSGVKVSSVEEFREIIVTVVYRLGRVYMELGEYDAAEKYLKRAYNTAEDGKIWSDEIESKIRMEELVRTMAHYYGTCKRDSEGYSEAIKWINKALDYGKDLLDVDEEYMFRYIEDLRYKGGLLEHLENYDAAEKVYTREILNLLQNASDMEFLLEKAYVYDDLGNVYEAKMRRQYTEACCMKAYEYYNVAYEIREKLLKTEDISREWLNKVYAALTFSYDNLCRIGMLDKDIKRGSMCANTYSIKNVELCEKLYEIDSENSHNAYNLFYAYIRVAELNINLDFENAKVYFEKAKGLAANIGLDKQTEVKNIIEKHQTNYFA